MDKDKGTMKAVSKKQETHDETKKLLHDITENETYIDCGRYAEKDCKLYVLCTNSWNIMSSLANTEQYEKKIENKKHT